MSASRTELAARQKADAKRLSAINGPRPAQALRKLSARELFIEAQSRRQASRTVEKVKVPNGFDSLGRKKTKVVDQLSAPTFRNVIDDNGAWV